jgi:hypothetical protein
VLCCAGMNRSYQEKMAAMAFLAALLNAGVVPPSVMHSCLAELLRGVSQSATWLAGESIEAALSQILPALPLCQADCESRGALLGKEWQCLCPAASLPASLAPASRRVSKPAVLSALHVYARALNHPCPPPAASHMFAEPWIGCSRPGVLYHAAVSHWPLPRG